MSSKLSIALPIAITLVFSAFTTQDVHAAQNRSSRSECSTHTGSPQARLAPTSAPRLAALHAMNEARRYRQDLAREPAPQRPVQCP